MQLFNHVISSTPAFKSPLEAGKQDIRTFDKQDIPSFDKQDLPNPGKEDIRTFDNQDIPSFNKQDIPIPGKQDIRSFDKQDIPSFDKEDIPNFGKQDTSNLGKQDIPNFNKPQHQTESKVRVMYYPSEAKSQSFDASFDPAKLLTRVSIPKFSGNKRNYEAWKAAFTSCVDNTTASPEYKLLRLHNCLEGEALKVIESLGHSSAAYEVAKERLERKYGGKRRQIALRLEDVSKFKQVRDGNARDLESFAELLDILIVNLKDAGQQAELGGGSLYISLQRKLSETLLSRYNRWIYENYLPETVDNLRVFVNQESDFLTNATEIVRGLTKETRREQLPKSFVTQTQSTPTNTQKRNITCSLCSEEHGMWTCQKFKALDIDQRWEKVKSLHVCFRCLSSSHQGKDCPRSKTCGVDGCSRTHHKLLHKSTQQKTVPHKQDSKETLTGPLQEVTPKKGDAGYTCFDSEPDFIALRTVPIVLRNDAKTIRVNALLDDASTKSYINSDVAAELGLEGRPEMLTVNVLNDNQAILSSSTMDFVIESVDGQVKRSASAYTTKRVTGNMQVIDWSRHKDKWKHLPGLKFPQTGQRPIVDVLIGVDQPDLHCSLQEVRSEPGEPIARLTPLGWTCIGYPKAYGTVPRANFTFCQPHPAELNNLVRRFWEIEEPQLSVLVKPDEKQANEIASKSLTYENGRYCVGIPWKQDKSTLSNNHDIALKRLQNTEKRLLRDQEVGKSYQQVMNSYLEKGYIRRVTPCEDKATQIWYLPHFPVLRPDKSTTKTRIVFDASAKHDGVSLNDIIHQGPKLQNDLFAVLTRFRRNPIAIMCDIAEMYLQIDLMPEDRPMHRFLWRDLDQSKSPDVYEFNRVVFGVNSSPFLAQFVSQRNAKENQSQYPLAADTVLKSTYMDDSMDSVKDVSTAVELRDQLIGLWAAAGMHARKWLSNHPDVLRDIPSADRATAVDLDSGQLPSAKTLGVAWNPEPDMFTFSFESVDMDHLTKRSFLSRTASLFDPLCLLMPFTIRAKILLQKIWTAGLEWDQPLTHQLMAEATTWFKELPHLVDIRVPRCLRADNGMDSHLTLHTFADASLDAYGATIYAVHKYANGSQTSRLVAAKARVAPLQAVSVPRLELMAAVHGLKLTQMVGETLEVDKSDWHFWSDSMDVLHWIRGHSRHFKPFVANRVGEIQAATEPEQWRFVPTHLNPADLLTRGQTVPELTKQDKWWQGPEFLLLPPSGWPVNKVDIPKEPNCEVKKQFQAICNFQAKSEKRPAPTKKPEVMLQVENRLEPSRHSRWPKLVRITAQVLRFANNCRSKLQLRTTGPLQPEEIKEAEVHFIKLAQLESFPDQVAALRKKGTLPSNSKLLPLSPFLDDDGVIRCNSRLQFADCLSWATRFPVILPRRHVITSLIVREAHNQCKHGGTNQVLANLSSKYWVISAREAIRDWEKECAMCQRRKANPINQVMAPLTEYRTNRSFKAFNQASVDFAGPFLTKQGRGKTRQKRYLCLFTCLSTRAVHLEMAYSMDTDSFLNAFYRMTSRRGLPQVMVSDNGTNFVSGDRELKELVAILDKDKIQDSTANRGVKWHFNPPGAPHFNGVHEVMIKAAKKAIKAILGNADITDEELMSAIVGAEGLINSRPLTYQSANPCDEIPLTPNHFLHGQMGGQFAPESVDNTTFNPRKRWRRVQELVRHFWQRWLREWLPGLSPRQKWSKTQRDLKTGDLVLIVSPDTQRGKWPLGRVIQTYPGPDGHVRTADVQLKDSVLKRSVVKLCPID